MTRFCTWNAHNMATDGLETIGQTVCVTTNASGDAYRDLARFRGAVYRVPPWTTMIYAGPWIPQFKPVGFLTNRYGEKLQVTPDLEMWVERFFDRHLEDPQAITVFYNECAAQFGALPFESFTDLEQLFGEFIDSDPQHSSALLDGVAVPLRNWELPKPQITRTGHMVQPPRPRDVILNTDEPGSFWVAKWPATHTTTGWSFVTVELNQEDFFPVLSDDDTQDESDDDTDEGEIIYIGDDSANSDGGGDTGDSDIGDGAGGEDDPDEPGGLGGRPEQDTQDGAVFIPETVPTLDTLSPAELELLPLGFIISLFDEWRLIEQALTSRFNLVAELNKVRDHTLALAADILALNFHRLHDTAAAQYFIDYAAKRNV